MKRACEKTNRQKMAEWLAENVLGVDMAVYASSRNKRFYSAGSGIVKSFSLNGDGLAEFIYSPDGFFAVWDALEAKDLSYISILKGKEKYNCFVSQIDMKPEYYGKGKDRYDAFYSAVKEAWEGE